ncbi:hypothetical protein AUJ68_05780 [Candidatus Woesearchaeota archaeon CG1_02_57_44]|nr:MAG: hypothetical protein AUJ68_05780 [Candidatus Woesearchaeota archaeon CG1_02_57_44]
MDVSNIQFTKAELRILTYLFKHYNDELNSRTIARLLGINHAHTNKLCQSLVNKSLLTIKSLGNANYYSFAYASPSAISFMTYLLSIEARYAPSWLTVPIHSLQKFNQHIELGIIFGSSIHNKQHHDIDVLLMYEPDQSKNTRSIKQAIQRSQLITKPVRYVDITPVDILTNKDNPAFYSMLSENIIFHNPETYVRVVQQCLKSKNTSNGA